MAEAYKINGKGLYEIFGTRVIKDAGTRESSDSFMQWPDRKSSLTIDREDSDGIEIDLADPKFSPREFVLTCAMEADDRADFFNKYNGLRTEFFSAETHELYILDHDKTYYVYYKSQRNYKSLTNINQDGVWATFEIILGERNPSQNMEAVYLVDDQDRYLIE